MSPSCQDLVTLQRVFGSSLSDDDILVIRLKPLDWLDTRGSYVYFVVEYYSTPSPNSVQINSCGDLRMVLLSMDALGMLSCEVHGS